ncbi:hypothetical protein RB595_010729 [Gaeumannomyces hyphopodioides]
MEDLMWTFDPLSWLMRTRFVMHRSAGEVESVAVNLVTEDKDTFMYGAGDFDSSWGAATRLILQNIGEMRKAREGLHVRRGLGAGVLAPHEIGADTVYRELSEEFWLELHARLENTAKKCAARAEQVAARARAQLEAGGQQTEQSPVEATRQVSFAECQHEQILDARKVMGGRLDQELIVTTQQENIHPAAQEGPDLPIVQQQELEAHQPNAATAAAAAASEGSETCNFRIVQEWIRSDRTTPRPKTYCPICQDVEFTMDSLKPAGSPLAQTLDAELGIVMDECKHIMGVNCFRLVYSEAGENVTCPMCRAAVIPRRCSLLTHSIANEFSAIAIEQREMMDWP